MSTYFDHAAGIIPRDVFELAHSERASEPYRPRREDTVDLPVLQVLEGEAAEISQRAYLNAQQRAELERALELVP